jgi:hypothetical protein
MNGAFPFLSTRRCVIYSHVSLYHVNLAVIGFLPSSSPSSRTREAALEVLSESLQRKRASTRRKNDKLMRNICLPAQAACTFRCRC